jgi:hypothetical protein
MGCTESAFEVIPANSTAQEQSPPTWGTVNGLCELYGKLVELNIIGTKHCTTFSSPSACANRPRGDGGIILDAGRSVSVRPHLTNEWLSHCMVSSNAPRPLMEVSVLNLGSGGNVASTCVSSSSSFASSRTSNRSGVARRPDSFATWSITSRACDPRRSQDRRHGDAKETEGF